MIIDVNFMYEAKVRRPRKRSDDEVCVRDRIPVEIQEAAEDDCPLVLTMQALDQQYPQGARVQAEFRHFAGALWRTPVFHTYSCGPEQRMTRADLIKLIADGHGVHGAPNSDAMGAFWQIESWKAERAVDLSDPATGRLISDDRADMVARIHAGATRFLLVGDQVLYRTVEPVISLCYGRAPHYLASIRASIAPSASTDKGDNYRADRAASLLKIHEEVFGASTAETRERFLASAPQVFRPDLLSYPDEERAFRKELERFVGHMRDRLADASRSYLVTYADLRDAFASSDETAATLHHVEAPFERAIESVSLSNGEEAVSRARGFLDRWRSNRPTTDLDALDALPMPAL